MKADIRRISSNRIGLLMLFTGGIALMFLLNIAYGSVSIPFDRVIAILAGSSSDQTDTWATIILKSRLPQAVTATLAGGGLAVGGLMMQTLFRNPLAGPSILGISSGASLGVAFIMMFIGQLHFSAITSINLFGNMATILMAIAGAVATLFLILFFARKIKDNAMLLILGIMISYITSALVDILKYYSTSEHLHSYAMWGLGSFSNVAWPQLEIFIPVVVLGMALSFLLMKPLNILLLGENYAANLGLNVHRTRFFIILTTGILTAVITAFCGPIVFLGLAVPHITKMVFKTSNHSILLPGVILTGILLALICNFIARLPGFESALPINVVTSIFGAPIVISVILRQRRLKLSV
ncbi:MAG: iron ABC transporter permease [Bacteroidales bacterium]|nr:iron ABC transporter permease [Bacteroidales bacterium]